MSLNKLKIQAMIKRLVQYFRKRKEMRLRKWCIEKSIKYCACGEDVSYVAGRIYQWIKEPPISPQANKSPTEKGIINVKLVR